MVRSWQLGLQSTDHADPAMERQVLPKAAQKCRRPVDEPTQLLQLKLKRETQLPSSIAPLKTTDRKEKGPPVFRPAGLESYRAPFLPAHVDAEAGHARRDDAADRVGVGRRLVAVDRQHRVRVGQV